MATILAAEDSPSTRRIIAETLRGIGHEVVEAGDGQDALEKARISKVELVITDINMPRMDGFALVKALRSDPIYKYIPIIILTTESTTEKKMMGKEVGATAWIVKPFSPDNLSSIVNKVLR